MGARTQLGPNPITWNWVTRLCRILCLLPVPMLAFSQGLAADPCQQGSQALQQKNFVLAETALKRCLAARPAELRPYLELCGLYQTQGREGDLAGIASEGLKRFPGEQRFYMTVGNHAGRAGQYERAVQVFAEAHRRWPLQKGLQESLADAHLYLGLRFLDKAQNVEAEPHLQEAVRLAERDIDARLNLGRALHNLNRSVEAIAQFDRVIAIAPKTPLVWFHRGMVRQALGELEGAVADVSEEIRLNPGYPPSYLVRGRAYFTQARFTEALADLDLAVKKMPENGKAVFARGRCLQQLQRLSEAEEDYRKAVSLEPDNPEPMNTLARLLLLGGKREESESLFQEARRKSIEGRTVKAGEIQFASPSQR